MGRYKKYDAEGATLTVLSLSATFWPEGTRPIEEPITWHQRLDVLTTSPAIYQRTFVLTTRAIALAPY